jgi:hypothetical protein
VNKLKSTALIAAGYALAVGGGLAAVAVNDALIPADVAQTSPGMVAFGAILRMVLGPVLLVIEGVTFVLLRARASHVRSWARRC